VKTLVIVPIYNEETHLARVLNEIKESVSPETEVLAINDGSTDRSAEILDGMQGITVLTHPQNMSYGQTLIDGFRYAIEGDFEAAITMDCDGQHDPRQIPEFEREVASWDIASGSRYLTPSSESAPAARAEINRKLTAMLNELTGLNITDAFCGFKAYRVQALKKLDITEPGYGMPLQVWVQVAAHKLRVKEIPVPLVYLDRKKTFPGKLSQPEERLRYYLSIIERERARYRDLLSRKEC
jgi:glycosyltransferase involved in cell wall biosynthesis